MTYAERGIAQVGNRFFVIGKVQFGPGRNNLGTELDTTERSGNEMAVPGLETVAVGAFAHEIAAFLQGAGLNKFPNLQYLPHLDGVGEPRAVKIVFAGLENLGLGL